MRANPIRRPIGSASLVAIAGFLVLMVMAEYVEQPGKVLVWTLLGVAAWDAIGRLQRDCGPYAELPAEPPIVPEPALPAHIATPV